MMTEPALEAYDEAPEGGTFLRALPGGRGGTPDQIAVALLVTLALAYLVFMRRGFKSVLAS